jgi:glycoside/pentoside/hexuronide:cation symporter, GPH family
MREEFMNGQTEKLPLREKVGYGFGDLASVLFWQCIVGNLMLFYTDVYKIAADPKKAAAVAGLMIGLATIFDGIIDPVIGMIADRTETRWGKFRPYLIWMSVPLMVSAILTFMVPGLGPIGKLVYAYLTLFLFRACYAAINIPYSSLLGVLSPDSKERTSASSFKFAFAYTAGFIVTLTSLILAKHLGNGKDSTDPKGWTYTILLYGCVAVVFFTLTFLLTRERVKPQKGQKTTVGKDLLDLVTNVPWIILLLATLSMILFVSTRMGVTNYYFKYYITENGTVSVPLNLLFWKFNLGFEEIVSAFGAIGQLCAILGTLLVPVLVHLMGKKNAFFTIFGIAIISTAAFYFLKPGNMFMIFALQIIGSLTGGPLSPVIWAMYADTADYSEWKRGRRATGLVFSASAMSQKVGWALGATLTGILLSSYSFVPNQIQSPEANKGIVMLMSTIPAAFGILSVVLIFFYILDDNKMKQIKADLEERRKASGETAAV